MSTQRWTASLRELLCSRYVTYSSTRDNIIISSSNINSYKLELKLSFAVDLEDEVTPTLAFHTWYLRVGPRSSYAPSYIPHRD
jgi:hypothetical protein